MGRNARKPADDNQGAISAEQLAKLLSQATGSPVAADDVLSDVAAGAPVLPDGRIPLLAYVCWLYRMAEHDG